MDTSPENRRLSLVDHSGLRPHRIASPGEILREELRARGWSQAEFAEIIGRPPQFVSNLLNAKRRLTPESALLIGAATNTPATFWAQAEADFRVREAESQIDVEAVRRRAACA